MKVVLFCGGLGSRLRDGGEGPPKPMTMIGHRPILWHVMRWYAHHGHRDFVLCLGYGARTIKEYFLGYEEAMSNDFVLSGGGKDVELLGSDIGDWRITFIDTGLHTSIGQRLARVRHLLADDQTFLANYGDVLTDAPLDDMISRLHSSDAVVSLLAVPAQASFHTLQVADGRVTGIRAAADSDLWVNGGYFVCRQELFDHLGPGEDLVEEPFERLAKLGRLMAYPWNGFWVPMDTIKDRQRLEDLGGSGRRPWAVWESGPVERRDCRDRRERSLG